MFYLAVYFGSFKRASGLMFVHTGLLLLIILSVVGSDHIQQRAESFFFSVEGSPYFYAVVSGKEDSPRITEKMRELPGVREVSLVESKEIQQKTREALAGTQAEYLGRIKSNFLGFKVVFERNLKLKSMKLIRRYLERLVQEGPVTVGSIKNYRAGMGENIWITNAGAIVTLVLCLLWLIVNYTASKGIRERAYLVEQFQRKKTVALKTYLASMGLLIFVPTTVMFPFVNLSFIVSLGVMAMIIIGAINYREVKWQ